MKQVLAMDIGGSKVASALIQSPNFHKSLHNINFKKY